VIFTKEKYFVECSDEISLSEKMKK